MLVRTGFGALVPRAHNEVSRIIRHSYHTPGYVELTKEAYADWADLERDSEVAERTRIERGSVTIADRLATARGPVELGHHEACQRNSGLEGLDELLMAAEGGVVSAESATLPVAPKSSAMP